MTVTVSEYTEREIAETYNTFVDFYKNTAYTMQDIGEKMDLSPSIIGRLVKEAILKGDVKPRERGSRVTYYTGRRGKVQVRFRQIKYGWYKDKETAMMVADEMKKYNWDKKMLPEVQEKLGLTSNHKNYHEIKGRFYVSKWRDGSVISYGGYPDEKTAARVVAELKKVDWDKEQLPAIREKLGV